MGKLRLISKPKNELKSKSISNLMKDVRTNQKDAGGKEDGYPTVYKARFIEPGPVSYGDMTDVEDTILLTETALYNMAQSFIGKPVIIDHVDINPDIAKEKAVGYVTSVRKGQYENDNDPWWYCEFIIDDDKAKELIQEDFNISCAYVPTEVDLQGGEYHAIPYAYEVLNAEYTHLAIVDNPRYENAMIFKNSKSKGDQPVIFKLFNKKGKGSENKNKKNDHKEKTMDMDMDEAVYINDDGEEIPVKDMMYAYEKYRMNRVDDDDEYEMDDGEKVKMKEMYDVYKKNKGDDDEDKNNKKNEDDDDDKNNKKNEDDDNDDKKMKKNAEEPAPAPAPAETPAPAPATPAPAAPAKPAEPVNKEVKNARDYGGIYKDISLHEERLEKGVSRYGKIKKDK